MNFFRKLTSLGVTLTLVFTTVNATAAHAQIAPYVAPKQQAAPAQHSELLGGGTAASAPAPKKARVISMAEYTEPGGTPRAANIGNIGRDSPTINEADFNAAYPEAARNGVFNLIAEENQYLCEVGKVWLDQLSVLRLRFGESGTEYQKLKELYESMPDEVKRATLFLEIAQVASAGALCVLSAGLYCIAVVVTMVGNVFVSKTNKKLTLANIRLSLANIQLTQGNIDLSILNADMSSLWIKRFMPFCEKAGYVDFRVVNTPR